MNNTSLNQDNIISAVSRVSLALKDAISKITQAEHMESILNEENSTM